MKPYIVNLLPNFLHSDLLIDNEFEAEKYIEGVVEPTGPYDLALFHKDNQLIIGWFEQLAELFACWQHDHGKVWNKDKLRITGARSFGVSYTESDLDCAIVSDNIEDYLAFCSFLLQRYETSHQIHATKTEAGLPLFIVKKKGDRFDCPLLNTLYADNKFPKLEITFRNEQVYKTIQDAGHNFFTQLPDQALWNYRINKRRLTLMLRNDINTDLLYEGRKVRDVLMALKMAIMKPINVLENENLTSFPFDLDQVKQFSSKYPTIEYPPTQISSSLSAEADFLLHNSQKAALFPVDRDQPLRLLANGERLAPNEWALAQEQFEPGSPLFNFFQKHREQISSQLKLNGKYYTSVPIITFRHHGELYVLLMENKGLQHSSDVKEIQWTAHGTRVDSREKELLHNAKTWVLFDKITRHNPTNNYLLASAYRCVTEMGIAVSEERLSKIHLINRDEAGFPEENGHYHTAFFHIDLGERTPEEIVTCCHKPSSSRYGHWTQCFKVADLLAQVKEVPHPTKKRESYQLTYEDKTLTVRMTTMRFIMALNILKEVPQDIDINSPWKLHNVQSIELALNWIHNRTDEAVQISLFSNRVNQLSSAQIHAYAYKAGLNEENLAYLSIKPERLALHHLLAQLTVRTKIKSKEELTKTLAKLTKSWNEKHLSSPTSSLPTLLSKIVHELKELLASSPLEHATPKHLENNARYARMKALYEIISKKELNPTHKALYHLDESDANIALIITAFELYHAELYPLIKNQVTDLVQRAIDNNEVEELQNTSLDKQQFFGVTGPVASGKSVSEGLARIELAGESAAFISSDEWNTILIAILELGPYKKQQGKLTLAEAWFVKKLIWQLLAEMSERNVAVHLIQEAMSPLSLNYPKKGKTNIFLNTASPTEAINRVQTRGELTGRYIAGSETFASYRWPWLNLIAAIDRGMASQADLILNVIDTDKSYTLTNLPEVVRALRSKIVTVHNNCFNILDLQRFIYFVNRGYMINPAPQNQTDAWLLSEMDVPKLHAELEKLYDVKHQLIVQLEGTAIAKEVLFAKISDVLIASQQTEHSNPEEKFTIPTLKEQLETLSVENKEYLAQYGNWDNSAAERSALSISGVDEFDPIRNALYQLFVVLNYKSVAEIKAVLLKPHQEEGYSFAGLTADTAELSKNIEALCQLRDQARKKWSKGVGDDYLIKCFLIHNLGKMKGFLEKNSLENKGSATSSSHDLYLKNWLSNKPDLSCANTELTPWVEAFIGLGYNPQIMAKPGYVGVLAGVNEHVHKLDDLLSNEKAIRHTFKSLLKTLPKETQSLLAYYGDWEQAQDYRASLSITGVDEYFAIRTSLYLLFIVLNNETVNDIKTKLTSAYQEEGFNFAGIADTPDLIKNIEALRLIRDSARQKWNKDQGDGYLLKSFVIHDLGKIKAFLLDKQLAKAEEMSAANHDLYLDSWLELDPKLKNICKELSNWVDVFDGAGYNPQHLARAGYIGKLTIINIHVEIIKKFIQERMNSFLYQKAKALKIPLADFSFLIHQDTYQTSWLELTFEQQKKIIMLIWVSPFIFVKPPLNPEKVSQEFIEIWQSNKHNEVISKITQFMIKNMMADDFIFLYNITGLIHHTSAQNGSHFANGGTVDDLFTTFFPFVLNAVSGKIPNLPIQEPQPRGLNKFQALQGVEMSIKTFLYLWSGDAPSWKAIEFTSPECKQQYLRELAKTIDARTVAMYNPYRFMAVSAAAVSSEQSALMTMGADLK